MDRQKVRIERRRTAAPRESSRAAVEIHSRDERRRRGVERRWMFQRFPPARRRFARDGPSGIDRSIPRTYR